VRGQTVVWLLLAAMIAIGITLRCNHLMDVGSRSPDERVYTYFAQRIADQGFRIIPALFDDYITHKEAWDYPPPIRITYPILVAAAMETTGWGDVRAGVVVSFLSSCLSLVLLAWTGVRFFNPWIALAAVTFLAFSVGELGTARRAWQDSTFGLFGLLLMYVTCEMTRNSRKVFWYVAFFTLGAVLLLTKQTGLVAYGLCGLWATWVLLVQERSWRCTAFLVLGSIASLAITMAILSLFAGGLDVALSALDHSVHPGDNAYVTRVTLGPWYQFFDLLWITGPFTAAMTVIGLVVIIFAAHLHLSVGNVGNVQDARAAGCAVVMVLGFAVFAGFFPYMQNLRYITPANGANCLIAGVGLCYLLGLSRQHLPALANGVVFLVVIATIAVTIVGDYNTFTSVVVRSGMQDLAVVPIRQRMRPY
jgi:4-amino-4-deoxy-L-arabinose transferase-like glycosyltransferase